MEYITPYYTNRELDSLFVEDSPTGVTGSINATCLGLVSLSGLNSISWGQRNLVSGTQKNLSWQGGIGFFGATPVSKPSGSNVVNSVSSLGLASYSAITGSNFPSLIFDATGISYSALTGTQDIALSVSRSGIVTTFSKASGSNFLNIITSSGLVSSQYTASTSTNFYTNLNATNIVSVGQITGNNVYSSMANACGATTFVPSYVQLFEATRSLGFLYAGNPILPQVNNVVSLFANFPEIVSPSKAPTLGIWHWSDATFITTTSLHFGIVPSCGGVVTRAVSFGGTISSSVLTWWNPASFSPVSPGETPGVISSAVTLLTSSQVTFGQNIGSLCFLGLPLSMSTQTSLAYGVTYGPQYARTIYLPRTSAICDGLIFKIINTTLTGAVIECTNASRLDANQSTAPFRILAF